MPEFRIGDRTFDSQETFVVGGRRCGTPVHNDFQKVRVRRHLSALRAAGVSADAMGQIVIGVHFHILHDGNAGNLTEAQIESQRAVLNECYQPHGIAFQTLDITRTKDARWFKMTMGSAAEREAKRALHKDTASTLNFYTAGIGAGLLGWATFPSELAGDPEMDGVVMLHSTLPGGASAPYDLGKTAVHEVGHWLGLYHTFEGGCAPPGDEVDDTPFEASPNFGPADPTRDTCPGVGRDPVTNFMDYTDDAGMNEFTPGQVRRIKDHIALYRPDLMPAGDAVRIAGGLAIDLYTGDF